MRILRATPWVALLSLAAGEVRAQAVCSAPHSGPVVASGQASTLAPLAGWFQLSFVHQETSTIFYPDRVARPLILDGTATTTSAYASAALGVLPGLEVWGQIPFHTLDYTDNGGSRARSGFGDPRLSVRLGPALFALPSLPVALRAGVKLPGSSFPVDATIIPLTEGQRDWELSLESWRQFAAGRLYLLGWVGYRWREENRDAGRTPGNELFVHAAVGGPFLGRFHWELAGDVLRGAAPEQQGVTLDSAQRELLQVQPTLAWNVGPGRAGVSAQVPLLGRNLPASPGFSAGYLLTWGGR